MAVIRIQTVLSNDKVFRFEIESDDLYTIHCLTKTPIQTLDKIYQICIAENIVIITTEDRGFRNGATHVSYEEIGERRENNILAYDWQGNFLWNIGEIVGDIKMPFSGLSPVEHQIAQEEYGAQLLKGCGLLLHCTAGGYRYLIDATHKTVLTIRNGKW